MIIFDDVESKERLNNELNDIVRTLNENHEKVMKVNPNLTPRITLLQTFYNYGQNWPFDTMIRKEIYEECKRIVTNINPFYTEENLASFILEMNSKLHRADCRFYDNCYHKIDDLRYKEKDNVTVLNDGLVNIPEFALLPSYSRYKLANDYTYFKNGKFYIDSKKVGEWEKQCVHESTNKKQVTVLTNLKKIAELTAEINKISDVNYLRYILPNGEFRNPRYLYNLILSIS